MPNYVQASASILSEKNPFVMIERAGRTCYKSESEFTPETGKKFVTEQLVPNKHFAMLEHATFAFEVTTRPHGGGQFAIDAPAFNKRYVNITQNGSCRQLHRPFGNETKTSRTIISGNLRALNECGWYPLWVALSSIDPALVYSADIRQLYNMRELWDLYGIRLSPIDISTLSDLTHDEFLAHHYTTFHIVCDRGVSHELVRHRPASWAQESTRYCNYSKDKYGNEITFVYPSTYKEWPHAAKRLFEIECEHSEDAYMFALDLQLQPQQARALLSTCVKTEVIMTANAQEYKHFFNLRYFESTGKPHPDMLYLTKNYMYPQYVENVSGLNSNALTWISD